MSRHRRRRRYRTRRGERREKIRRAIFLLALGGVSPFEALLLAQMARMHTVLQHSTLHLFHRLGL